MRDRLRKLRQLFYHDHHLLIRIDADLDSIASALALKRILWRRITSCIISPIRPITRPRIKPWSDCWKYPLPLLEQIDPAIQPFCPGGFQPSHNQLFADFKYDVIIDHHPLSFQTQARFVDIRSEYGSTCQNSDGIPAAGQNHPPPNWLWHYFTPSKPTPTTSTPLHRSRYSRLSLSLPLYPACPGAHIEVAELTLEIMGIFSAWSQ